MRRIGFDDFAPLRVLECRVVSLNRNECTNGSNGRLPDLLLSEKLAHDLAGSGNDRGNKLEWYQLEAEALEINGRGCSSLVRSTEQPATIKRICEFWLRGGPGEMAAEADTAS